MLKLFHPRAGDLDQRVTIERKSVARDAALGSEIITWVLATAPATVWARCTDVRESQKGGDEAVVHDQRLVQSRTTVLIRWRGDVTTDMRIQWPARSRTLQIVSKAEIGRRDGLELSCEEFNV